MNDIQRYIESNKDLINEFIKSYFLSKGYGKKLSCNSFSLEDSMLYTLLNGGKRIRPVILLMVAESLGFSDKEKLLPFAVSLELIHSYSLIHDDLPSMDNDSMRRGKPTNHLVYGEASAILAGDALLTEAFSILAENSCITGVGEIKAIKAIRELANASGAGGLVGGQFLDVNSFESDLQMEEIEFINHGKTARLIGAACAMGAILAGVDDGVVDNFRKFGIYVGLTFQTVDDILDFTGSQDVTGKTSGIDEINKKCNIPGKIGLDKTYELINKYNDEAFLKLEESGIKSELLENFINYLTKRIN